MEVLLNDLKRAYNRYKNCNYKILSRVNSERIGCSFVATKGEKKIAVYINRDPSDSAKELLEMGIQVHMLVERPAATAYPRLYEYKLVNGVVRQSFLGNMLKDATLRAIL